MRPFIPKRVRSLFHALILLTSLYSIHTSCALSEGREAFSELSSWRIFTQDPLDLVSTPHKQLLVAGMARTQALSYIPHEVVGVIVDYIALDHGYSTEQLRKLKKGAQIVRTECLDRLYIAKESISLALEDKVPLKRIGSSGQRTRADCYPINDLLNYLLLGKKKQTVFQRFQSLLCSCFCHCCQAAADLRLQTYEEAIAEGWSDAHIIRLKKAIECHMYYNRAYYMHNKALYQAIGFYMDPAYYSGEQESLSILLPTD